MRSPITIDSTANLERRRPQDLVALGCVMYEMLTGEVAFSGPSAHAVIARRFAYSPPRITDSRPEVSAVVGDTASRLLQRSADDRFASGAQVVAAAVAIKCPYSSRLGRLSRMLRPLYWSIVAQLTPVTACCGAERQTFRGQLAG